MHTYILKDVKFLEVGDYDFQVQFSYNGLLLRTNHVARGATQEELERVITDTAKLSEQKRSDDNFITLKSKLEKPEVEIIGA